MSKFMVEFKARECQQKVNTCKNSSSKKPKKGKCFTDIKPPTISIPRVFSRQFSLKSSPKKTE